MTDRGPDGLLPEPDTVALAQYVSLLRRHLRMLVLLVLLGAVGGAIVAVATPPSYTATASVMVPRVTLRPVHLPELSADTPVTAAREVTLDTEAQLVWSAEVLDRLALVPGLPSDRDEVRGRISIIVPANTRVFDIGVRAGSPTAARSSADAVAQSYIALRNRIVEDAARRDRAILDRRIAALRRQLDVIQANGAQPADHIFPVRQRTVVRQLNETRGLLIELEGRLGQDSQVIRDARLPADPDDRAVDVHVASGIGIGLLCGLLVAAWRNVSSCRIRRVADIRGRTTVPVLLEPDGISGARDVPLRLRTIAARANARSVFVAGVPSDVALVAVGLAELYAELDGDTVLVDLREPGATAPPGTSAPATLRTWHVDSSHFRQRLVPTLERLKAVEGPAVVFGAPLDSGDALAAASAADVTVVVVETGRAFDRELTTGLEMLRRASVPVAGLMVVRPGPDRNGAGPADDEMNSVSPSRAGLDGYDDSGSRDRTVSTAPGLRAMAATPGGGRKSRVS
jgi:capsular polysaccharide biosynthesis protein